ncbi:MAG: ribose-phosphate pyrophosphokinase [Candidatus Woesearchaeota archaeon]|jgi:ribose-phosphate pyrophosphokinase
MSKFNQDDFAIVACRNGINSAERINENLKKICVEAEDIFKSKNNLNHRDLARKSFVRDLIDVESFIVPTSCATFADGEILPTINRSVREKTIYLVQNTFDPENPEKTSENIMELILTIDALKRSSPLKIIVIVPYLNYSKQERRQGRQSISAKVLLDLIHVAGADKLITIDLHTSAIEGFTSGNDMTIDHLFGSSVFIEYLREKKFDGVFAAPDIGAGKTIKHYSKVMNMPFALGYKFRKPDSKHNFEAQGILGEVEGKDVVMIDDQIASGSTLINAIKLLKEKGAKKIYLFATHGLFLKDAEQRFKEVVDQGIITELIITNSLIHSEEFLARNPKIVVLDVLKIFSKAIFEMQTGGSISGLYNAELRLSLYGDKHQI